jgi:hypothetical protein
MSKGKNAWPPDFNLIRSRVALRMIIQQLIQLLE